MYWDLISSTTRFIVESDLSESNRRVVDYWRSALHLMISFFNVMIGPPCGGVGSVFLPLGGEDAVEQRVGGAAALCWLQGEHVLQNVEGKLFGRLTDQRSFGEGRPLLLQSSLSTNVVLKHQQREQTSVFLPQRSIFSSAGWVLLSPCTLGPPERFAGRL